MPGSTEPEGSAGRHGSRPFPAVTDGYRRQAARSVELLQHPYPPGQALARTTRSALAVASPDTKHCPGAQHHPHCQRTFHRGKKNPGGLRTYQGFLPVWKVRPARLPDPLSGKAYLMDWPRSNSCESTLERSDCDHCARGSASPVGFSTGYPVGEPQAAEIPSCVAFQFMGRAVYRRASWCQHVS